MRYLGGKTRLSKYIAKEIINRADSCEQYVEPFVGSAAIAERLAKMDFDLPMILADASPDLILLYQEMQKGWVPPKNVSETMYNIMKNINGHSFLRGFVGYGCSWGGKFFGGYARGEDRNYADESRRSLQKTISLLSDAQFILSDYRELSFNKKSLIYCDPPYRGTTSYEAVPEFDSIEFWSVIREWSKNHVVICSEYYAPNDFKCIWSKSHTTSVRPKDGNEQRIEKLFMYKGETNVTEQKSST